MATPKPDSGAGAQAGSQKATPTMGAPGLRSFSVGGITLYVDKNAQAMHYVDSHGRVMPLPKGAHFNAQKKTVDLPGGDHLTFSGGQATRNTPQPKTGNKLDRTTYYKNPYTGPDQKVSPTGAPSAPKPVANGTPGPVPAGHAPGSAPLPPPSTAAAAAPRKAAAPAKKAPAPARTTPATAGSRVPAPVAAAAATHPAAPVTSHPLTPAAPGAPHPAVAPTAAGAAPIGAGVDQRIIELFGAGMGAYLHDRELGPILRQAATEGWSQLRLQGKLQTTSWWHNTADSARKWDVLNSLDHATARSQVEQQAQSITDAARTDGITLTPLQVHDLAVNALRNGWTAPQLRQHIYDGRTAQDLATAEQTKYGYLAGLADNPEVKALLEQGAREGWDQTRLQIALQGTNFWKQTTDAQRRWQSLNNQDPGTAKSSVTQQTTSILNTAQSLGVTLDPTRAAQIAQDSLRFGWSAEQVSKAVGSEYHYQAGTPGGGTASKSAADLKSLASQYMVPLSEATLGSWTQNIVRGQSDEAAFTDYLKEQAKVMRPWAAKQIDAGLTTQQLTDPYKQMIASTLEVAPDQVDFTLPKYSAILDGQQDAKTGAYGPMSLSAAQQYLRSLPDYNKTSAANDQAAQFVQTLTHTFGKVA